MKTKSFRRILAAALPLLLLLLSCKKEPPVTPTADPVVEPPKYEQSIFLSVIDSGLTEVYLKLTITDTLMPRGFEIQRNNLPLITGSLCSKETTIVDQTAEMHSTYSYRAFRTNGSIHKDSSSVITTQTLDTTSHDFVWTTERFGTGIDPSHFTDVTVLDNGDIWCVGEGSIFDSATHQSVPFNAVNLNGNAWTIRSVPTKDYGTLVGVFRLQSVIGFQSSDIWMTSYAELIRWNGNNYLSKAFFMVDETFNGQINKIWGIDNNNIYTAGRHGVVYYYSGSSWRKMSTGTTVDLLDIRGSSDGAHLWACGSSSDMMQSILLEYTNGNWITRWSRSGTVPVSPYFYDVTSLWYHNKLFVCNSTQVYTLAADGIARLISPSFNWHIQKIDGNEENDIAVATQEGAIWHYNGKSWNKVFLNSSIRLKSIAMRGSTIAAAGIDYSAFPSQAVVVMGNRQ